MTPKLPTKIEEWPLAKLAEHPRNARKHAVQQIEQIMASLSRFGFAIPVIVDPEGVVLAGHARVQAATKLGWKTAPVIVVHGWTDAQKRAYLIADNQLTLAGDWDTEKLGKELKALQAHLFDIHLTGFRPAQVHRLTVPKAPTVVGDTGVSSTVTAGGGAFLEWDGQMVPVTADESKALTGALTKYTKKQGSRDGFLRALIDGGL